AGDGVILYGITVANPRYKITADPSRTTYAGAYGSMTDGSVVKGGIVTTIGTGGGGGGMIDPTTTKGDLIARGAAAPATRLPAGADGLLLTADATQALGVKWAALPVSGSAVWRFDATQVAMADPGSGKLRFDTATPASAANVALSATTDPGTD